MKKLMIAAAIVCAAAMSQAATYDWTAKASAFAASSKDSTTYKGYLAYFFDANASDYTDITTALAGNDTSVLAEALGYGSVKSSAAISFKNSDNEAFEKIGAAGTPLTATGYMIVLNSTTVEGATAFVATPTKGVEISQAVETGGATFSFGSYIAPEWTAMDVPEPTSAMLLLLGVAGLALKRRRV